MGPVINCPCSDDNDRPDTQSSVSLPRFMSVRLYIGNLPQNFESKELEAQLTTVGEGIRFKAVLDRETGACRGFGFANVDDEKVADAVIEQFNGKNSEGIPSVSNARSDATAMPAAAGDADRPVAMHRAQLAKLSTRLFTVMPKPKRHPIPAGQVNSPSSRIF